MKGHRCDRAGGSRKRGTECHREDQHKVLEEVLAKEVKR